jgi:hypothetical protein
MTVRFGAVAIPCRDGSAADGVHLLWTAPVAAGYSVNGWDIQGRKAAGRPPELRCARLIPGQLVALHAQLGFRARDGSLRTQADEDAYERPPRPQR